MTLKQIDNICVVSFSSKIREVVRSTEVNSSPEVTAIEKLKEAPNITYTLEEDTIQKLYVPKFLQCNNYRNHRSNDQIKTNK